MDARHLSTNCKKEAIAEWKVLLQNESSLLGSPGAHHRVLLKQAHALYPSQVINHNLGGADWSKPDDL